MARAFGVAIALVGLLHLIFGEEPTRLFPMWPENLPGRPFWAHAAGALLLVLGGLLAAGQRRREAAAGISLVVVLSVLTQHLPRAVPSGALGVAWLSTIKFSALAAGAALVSLAVAEPAARGIAARALRFGATATPWLIGAFMAYSGYLHLRYTESVTRLLPPWMPWDMFWVRFTGVALVAGGMGLVTRPVARLAALLTAAMISGFFLLVHVPRTLANPLGSTGWLELGESAAFAIIALLLARSTQRAHR